MSLIEEVKAEQPWAEATIKTLLHRLIQKGVVKSIREDGRQRYHAMIDRETYVVGEVASLVQRLFADDPAALKTFLESQLN